MFPPRVAGQLDSLAVREPTVGETVMVVVECDRDVPPSCDAVDKFPDTPQGVGIVVLDSQSFPCSRRQAVDNVTEAVGRGRLVAVVCADVDLIA